MIKRIIGKDIKQEELAKSQDTLFFSFFIEIANKKPDATTETLKNESVVDFLSKIKEFN